MPSPESPQADAGAVASEFSTSDLVRLAERFSEAPSEETVEMLCKVLASPVARKPEDLDAGLPLERPAVDVAVLEKATRKIGVLSCVSAAARAHLCRRMNIVQVQMQPSGLPALFRQGNFPEDSTPRESECRGNFPGDSAPRESWPGPRPRGSSQIPFFLLHFELEELRSHLEQVPYTHSNWRV